LDHPLNKGQGYLSRIWADESPPTGLHEKNSPIDSIRLESNIGINED
jgi:hypothetical protein